MRQESGLEKSLLMSENVSENRLAQAFLAPLGMWCRVEDQRVKIECQSGKEDWLAPGGRGVEEGVGGGGGGGSAS